MEKSISVSQLCGYIKNIFDVEFSYLFGEDYFTLFLILTAERYTQIRKAEGWGNNNQVELAEWIIFWNDIFDNITRGNYKTVEDVWEDKKNRINWSPKYDNVVLKIEDYSESIIDYIINADTNNSTGIYEGCDLPILQDLAYWYCEDPKTQLYKYLYE